MEFDLTAHLGQAIAMDTISIHVTDQMQQAACGTATATLLAVACSVCRAARRGTVYSGGNTARYLRWGVPYTMWMWPCWAMNHGVCQRICNHLRAAYVPMGCRGGVRSECHNAARDVLDFARMRGETIVADLQCRDFTINAMACPLPCFC